MKKGYIVGEYIIVAFFFLILFVGIVDRVILVTSEELDLSQDHESCENAERIFKELVDKENNVSKYGISGGDSIVDYNSTKYLYDNKNLGDYNNDTNKTDSFRLEYEIKGFDVQSAYSTPRAEISYDERDSPVAQIWLNHTNGTNSSIVHNVIGIGSAKNTSNPGFVYLHIELVLPNATKVNSYTDTNYCLHSGTGDSVTFEQKEYGTLVTYDSRVNNGCDHRYISYTTDQTTYTDWDEHWTRYGSNFQAINDIQRNNNLIFIRDISFRNEALDKDYPIYLGNDTLIKADWGAPLAEGCEYKRLYNFRTNSSFLINQSVFDEQREVNITRNFIGEVRIISA